MKKVLSCQESVETAAALFLINTEEKGVEGILEQFYRAETAIVPEAARDAFFLEWYAFVHAGVVHALMEHAPASVVVGYVRQTHDMLENKRIVEEKKQQKFIDETFPQYLTSLVDKQAKNCPLLFLSHLGLPENHRGLAFISATMAMVLAAAMDTTDQYQMQA